MSRHNDKRRVIHLTLFMLVLFISVSFSARSHANEKLTKSDQVTIKSWLSDSGSNQNDNGKTPTYSINQQVILYIEVVTPRWFTGGTRIAPIEIPNVVAKQRNQLATNFTERRNGTTWTHQRWEVTLYPQSEGTFVIPPTAVKVQVSQEGAGNATGVLYTEPQRFSAIIPSGLLSDDTEWVAGRDFTLEQEWDSSNENLKAGDAITRTITIKGADTLAMLIPELIESTSNDRYQTYAQPNQLDDMQTRGDYLSERTESVVYVLQNGGEVTFPPVTLTWWDTKAQQLKSIELEGNTFAVAHTFSSWLNQYWKALTVVLGVFFVLIVLIIKVVRYYQTHPLPAWFVYSKAVKQQQWGQVRVLLYRTLRLKYQIMELKQHKQTTEWQQDAKAFQTHNLTKPLSLRVWKEAAQSWDLFSFISAKFKPNDVFPKLDKQRARYEKKQDNQHKSS